MLFVLDDPYGTERGLGALRSLGRKLMKGPIWKQLSLRIKASGKSLHIVVCFPPDHHNHVFSFTWPVWQMSPLKGTSQQSSHSHWYDVSCFPVCQLLGLWGMHFGDMRCGRMRSWLYVKGRKTACMHSWSCTTFTMEQTWGYHPLLPSQCQEVSFWEPACQWL